MVSKGQIKLITSLAHKKYRDNSGLFVAEGPKVVRELCSAGWEMTDIYSVDRPFENEVSYHPVSEKELQKMSFLKNANSPLALFKIPLYPKPEYQGLIVALDAIRDPGNLGTIIRLCDWFGIEDLVCSPDTADCYNPKVVQASMGSIARVRIHYLPLDEFLKDCPLQIYGACMEGTEVYSESFPEEAVLVLGNEGKGISEAILDLISDRITIPRFGQIRKAESLNVATATAILLSEIRRATGK